MTSVLVVDDDEASRTAIRRVLEAEGFEVTAAASGYSAVTALETTLFDAVIFDAAAPGLEGLAPVRTFMRTRADRADYRHRPAKISQLSRTGARLP